jgi:hypothetical protein
MEKKSKDKKIKKIKSEENKIEGKKIIKNKMKLADGLKLVFENNHCIRRESWPPVCFIYMRDGRLSIFLEDGEYHPWTITLPDVVADDWVIL